MEVLLSKTEMKILHDLTITDTKLENKTSEAIFKNNNFILNLEEEIIEDLLNSIAIESNHEENKNKENDLDNLFDNIEGQTSHL